MVNHCPRAQAQRRAHVDPCTEVSGTSRARECLLRMRVRWLSDNELGRLARGPSPVGHLSLLSGKPNGVAGLQRSLPA